MGTEHCPRQKPTQQRLRFGPPVEYMPVSFQAAGLWHPGFWRVPRPASLPIRIDVSGREPGVSVQALSGDERGNRCSESGPVPGEN